MAAWIALAIAGTRAAAWIAPHALVLACLCAFLACVLVSRRRDAKQAEARLSWVAALPVKTSTARWEALAIESKPALLLMCVALTIAPSLAGLTMSSGTVLGTITSYLLPAPKPVYLPPGSRYVPHRRHAAGRTMIGSLSALGTWPLRRMFASAQPKAVARATLPILLIMPLGTKADAAMLVIALFAVAGALALLVSAVFTVSGHASRWVKPLPLSGSHLVRRLLGPTLVTVACAGAAIGWLLWLSGDSILRSVQIGAVTLMAGSVAAVGACRLGLR